MNQNWPLIHVSEMSIGHLNCAIAKVSKLDFQFDNDECWLNKDGDYSQAYRPCTDWGVGGPLLERVLEVNGVELKTNGDAVELWVPAGFILGVKTTGSIWQSGESALVAAMRVIVEARFGANVGPEVLTRG